MRLSVVAVSKMTGFTESTVRQYAWKMKLGKKEGRQKFFTIAEAKKLGGLKDGSKKVKRARKPVAKKRKTTAKVVKPGQVVPKKELGKQELRGVDARKRSFWSFLGIGKR